MNHFMTSWAKLGIGSIVLALAASGCGGDDDEVTAEYLYEVAVMDAETIEDDEVIDTLVAITPDNDALIRDDDGRVLMVTWTSYGGYDDIVGQDTELGIDVWTTVAPEVKDFCRAMMTDAGEAALDLRLEQLLGLPPGDGNDRMVELWVPAEAMFRPTPDAEITDSVAALDFPADTAAAHIDWIESLQAESYELPGGYPWTRLGYTYDWNPDTPEVGLSEFVIAEGAAVGVASVTSTAEYCGR